ncbi:MAG: Trm112 family protein [Anaplasma sp.]
MRVDKGLLEVLVCPLTGGELYYDVDSCELVSKNAGLAFPVRSGIPIMLTDKARKVDAEDGEDEE